MHVLGASFRVGKLPHGIVEIKCPYPKREMMPEEACGDSVFCCELVDADICLKPTHVFPSSSAAAICWCG